MSQFVRKNIDVISSTSRPTTSDRPPLTPPDPLSDVSSVDEHLSTLYSPLSHLLFENYSFMPKSADPDFSSQSFRSALENCPNDQVEYVLPALIASSTTVATIMDTHTDERPRNSHPAPQEHELTSHQQLPTGYESIEEVHVDTSRAQLALWTGKQIIKKVKKLFGANPESSHPPQKTPDELERQPLLPRDPDNPDSGTRLPECYARLLSVPNIYFILGAIILAVLILIMIITGDPTLLFLAIRGSLCYLLGSTISGLLFGDDFCPAIEAANDTVCATLI